MDLNFISKIDEIESKLAVLTDAISEDGDSSINCWKSSITAIRNNIKHSLAKKANLQTSITSAINVQKNNAEQLSQIERECQLLMNYLNLQESALHIDIFVHLLQCIGATSVLLMKRRVWTICQTKFYV